MEFALSYLPLLLATLTIEGAVAFALGLRGSRGRSLQVCISLNLVTHSIATLILLYANAPFVLLEIAVTGVEFLGYRALAKTGVGRSLVIASTANLATAALAMFG